MLAGVSSILVAGCRFKGKESFLSATTPVEYRNGVGDPYASGGIAGATGGLNVKTHYGEGARNAPTGKLDAKLDQPAKGSGQRPGEQPQMGAGGYGLSNAPVSQPAPGDANNRN